MPRKFLLHLDYITIAHQLTTMEVLVQDLLCFKVYNLRYHLCLQELNLNLLPLKNL